MSLPARSHWLREALSAAAEEAPALVGDERADVCIVGGGFTGLWTAIRLKEMDPSLDVAIVEADVCGGGASGRNGGFVLSWWAKFHSLKKICGAEEAVRLAKASAEAVAEIGRFSAEHGIDAHYRADGWLWAATAPEQIGAWASTIDELEPHQIHPFEELGPTETARRAGSPRHLAGVFERTAASVQPARLARGLRRVVLERGVRIFENTPMLALERSKPPRVRTQRGSVTADKVVLALNAWGIRFPEIRRAIVVVASDIVATRPIPDRLAEIGWTDGLTISDGRMLVHYYRTTQDGRIAFGKGGMSGALAFGGRVGARFEGVSRNAAGVERWLKWTYPALSDVAVDTSWTGPIDRSKSGLPFFGGLGGRPDILYGVGYSGNGVGPSNLGGRILASLALGRDDEWAGCGLVRPLERDFPGEPIRYFGGHMVRAAIAAKDRAEDQGRRPGALTNYLARFAPAGLSPLKEKTNKNV